MKISIVMPLYNAETYLAECLDSILKQTFAEFELLCVNDGSGDATAEILQLYAARDSRISVFDNGERRGAAYSRNRGLAEATGEYLFFLDGDDVFDEEMLQSAYRKAIENRADIVAYQSVKTKTEQMRLKRTNKLGTSFVRIFCQQPFDVKSLKVCDFITFRSSPWDKIYRREFILAENLWFQELSCCNDVYFVNMALLLAKRIVWLDTEKIFVHVRDHGSPSRISTDRDPMCAYEADKHILEEVSARGKMPELYRHCYTRIYYHLLTTLKTAKDRNRAEQFYFFLQKEGIGRLQAVGGEEFQKLDAYIRAGFEKFSERGYVSGWYLETGELEAYLQNRRQQVCRMFDDWKKAGKKIGLWGAGQNGRIFAEFCHRNQIEIERIMDGDAGKQGKRLFQFPPICAPGEGIEQVQVVIFTNRDILEEVKADLTDRADQLELVDINSCLGIY